MTNWAIIGCGNIARKFAEDIQLVPKAKLYAVASRNYDKATAFKEKYHATKAFGNYREMLNDPVVQMVYIATPHNFHFEHTMMCFDHNKGVLCEKPSMLNSQQLAKVIKKAHEKKLFFMEALWTRFLPVSSQLLEILNKDILGEIYSMIADFSFSANYDAKHRLFNIHLAGGTILDIAIYPVFLSYLLLGKPDRIQASAILTPTGSDSQSNIILEYGQETNTASAFLHASLHYKSKMVGYIAGEKGYVEISPRWHESKKMTVFLKNGTEHMYDLSFTGRGFVQQIEAAQNAYLAGKIEHPWWSHQHSRELLQILDQIRKIIGVRYPGE